MDSSGGIRRRPTSGASRPSRRPTRPSLVIVALVIIGLFAPLAVAGPSAAAQSAEELFAEMATDCPVGGPFSPFLSFSDATIYCGVLLATGPCPGDLIQIPDPDGVFCLGRVAEHQPIQSNQTLPDFYTATDCDIFMFENSLAGAGFEGRCHVVTGNGTFRSTPIVASDGLTCAGEVVTVNLATGSLPTPGDDVILGTSGPDIIAGGAGNDVICGGGGDDVIWGQGGVDYLLGEDGNDKLRGGDDNDVLVGGEGADDLNGGRGDDLVVGEGGNDLKVRGGTGDDLIGGGKGDDDLVAGQGGEDSVYGGDGDDKLITGGPRPDMIYGGEGDDLLKGHKGADQLFGSFGDDDVRGGEQPDTIDGGLGNDTCNGGQQSDTATDCETVINVENSTPATQLRSADRVSSDFTTTASDHAHIMVSTQDFLNR